MKKKVITLILGIALILAFGVLEVMLGGPLWIILMIAGVVSMVNVLNKKPKKENNSDQKTEE